MLALLMMQSGACSAEIQVKPSDGALAEAIKKAKEGDTLVLGAGVYHEHVKVEKKLTIRGEPGAVLDGSTDLKTDWVFAEGTKNLYVAKWGHRPRGLLWEGKFIAEIRADRAHDKGDWNWNTLLQKGTPLSGFAQVRALWLYDPGAELIHVRLPDEEAATAKITAVMDDGPLMEIAAEGVVVENLVFRRGVEAVRLSRGAENCVVRKCEVASYEGTGILLTEGASGCVVENCHITRGALEEWQPTEVNRRENYEIWRLHKEVGKYDRVGIELIRAGSGNRILRNRLDRVFDGICLGDYKAESLDKPAADPNDGRGTEIAENVITNTRDSGIELGVGCVDVNVHHNTLARTHGGLRFKVPRVGPVYVHHNRLIEGTPFNIWFSMDSAPAEGYIYHNTILGGHSAAVVYSSFNAKRDFATPKWHLLNNLVLAKEGFFAKHSDKLPDPDFTASHNVSDSSEGKPLPEDARKDKGSLYGQKIEHDKNGRPAADSAAVDAGLDLSTYLKGKPLPGCEPGYFKGKAPDAGADEVK